MSVIALGANRNDILSYDNLISWKEITAIRFYVEGAMKAGHGGSARIRFFLPLLPLKQQIALVREEGKIGSSMKEARRTVPLSPNDQSAFIAMASLLRLRINMNKNRLI